MLLCSCSTKGDSKEKSNNKEYVAVSTIDRCVVEPDKKAIMTDVDRKNYEALMNALIGQKESVKFTLDNSEKENQKDIDFYFDLLRQSPYGFFLKDYEIEKDKAKLSYNYEKEQQEQMKDFLDGEFLKIVNYNAKEEDNELDTILKIYFYITKGFDYDFERTDNKTLDSPLFTYPDKEIYNFLKDKKGLCYGFAYTMRFALLQRGIDCFCVYGDCTSGDDSHMWNIFKYDGAFFNCDSAWDRASGAYAKLYHFGLTDVERDNDALKRVDFYSYHNKEYGKVECTDDRFKIFRTVMRYSYIKEHRFFMEKYGDKDYIFDTQLFDFI